MNAIIKPFLAVAMGLIAVLMLATLIRAVRGPRFTDRIVASNMLSTQTICFILLLSFYQNEAFLLDVALVYAMLGFLAVVVVTRVATYRHFGKRLHREGGSEGDL